MALRQSTLYLTLAGDHLFGKLDLNSGIFNIVAGDQSTIGDNGPALSSALVNPYGIALDVSGNLYVADTFHHRVRKIAPGGGGIGTGTITTIAGTGALPEIIQDLNRPSKRPLVTPGLCGPIQAARSTWPRVIGFARSTAAAICAPSRAAERPGTPVITGPAGKALFADLSAIVKDAAGNLYVADAGNNRIRKIDPGGTITTIAGNGIPADKGDDGPAKDAQVNYPEALALDGKGGLLVGDTYNHRVRRIDLSTGIITAVAGDGYAWGCCDGDDALYTSFRLPAGIAVAPNGDLYIADRDDQTVRWVDAKSGIVNTIAGQSGAQGQSGDGGPAREALLCSPRTTLSDSTGNLFLADTFNNRIRKISANTQPPDLSVDTCYRGLNLEAVLNSGTSVWSCLIVSSSNQAAINWSVTGSTNNGGNWLKIHPASGLAFSDYVWLDIDYANLSAGDYSANLTVTAAGATHSPQSFNLTLKVKPGEIVPKPPKLLVSSWAYIYAVAGATQPAQLRKWVWNIGGGTLQWSASAQTDTGGNWLTVTPASGTGEGTVTLSATVGSLTPAIYVGYVTFTNLATKETEEMKVYFIISPASGSLSLSHTGASFTGNEGAVFSAPKEIQILNQGQAELKWNASIPWAVGGDWLKLIPSSGTLAAAGSQTLTLSAVPGSLHTGVYDALVTVNAPNAKNAPQFISVRLAVQPADAAPVATIQPAGLALFPTAGGATVEGSFKIYTSGGSKSLGYVVSASTFDGAAWLSTTPVAGALRSSSDIATVTVRANPARLAPGSYAGKILVAFDTGVTQTVNVSLVVRAASTSAGSPQIMGRDFGVLADSNCASSQNVVQYSLVDGFTVLPSQSTPLLVRVFDACGTKLTASTVVASFNNGDEAITLTPLQNDAYVGMWHTTNRSKVTITFEARASGLPNGRVSVDGTVAPLGTLGLGMPSINPHGVVNAASYAKDAPLAPGQIISLFGSSLGTDAAGVGATTKPLPLTLNNVSAKLGDQDLPLYFANNNQVNAQVPPDVAPGQSLPLAVKVNGMVSPVEMVTFAAVQPGIFLWGAPDPATGLYNGVITFADYRVVTASSPAHAGDYIIIWATGLGATTPAVKAGEASPLSPLAVVNEPVSVSIGGKEVAAGWAGLTPYLVGLYQVNVQIPAGVPTGNTVQVFLKQNGVKSNIVTIPVR